MGKETPLYQARILGFNDDEVPNGQIGELVFRPPQASSLVEYYKNPEATAEKARGGWLRSGDMAYRDPEGFFFFVDRKNDNIRRRGENISSADIERVVNSHPQVLESAAVAVPSNMGEDEVKALIVLRPGTRLAPEELINFCEDRMAYFMVPRYLEFRASLPKTTTEKVMKEALKREGISSHTWDRQKMMKGREVRKL